MPSQVPRRLLKYVIKYKRLGMLILNTTQCPSSTSKVVRSGLIHFACIGVASPRLFTLLERITTAFIFQALALLPGRAKREYNTIISADLPD